MTRWLAMLAAVLLPGMALAAGGTERWEPLSKTAEAITGRITLEPRRMVFGNGASLGLASVRNIDFDAGAKRVPATLYRITAPADPVLLNGNRICGGGAKEEPVTFVVIWHEARVAGGAGDGRAFAAYSGANEPGPSVDKACGTFSYVTEP